jgi:DNA polymerase elongation subunit (family B)
MKSNEVHNPVCTYDGGLALVPSREGFLPDGVGELIRTGLRATPPHRVAVFDLETTGLDKDRDKIVLIGLLLIDERSRTFILEGDEKTVLQELKAQLDGFSPDAIVGHNAYKFDCPFINSRMEAYGMVPLFRGETANVRVGSEQKEIVVYFMGDTPVHDTYILAQRLDGFGYHSESFNLKSLAVAWLGMKDWGDYETAKDKKEYLKTDLEATYRLYRFTVAHWDALVKIVPVPYNPLLGNGMLVNTLFTSLMLPFMPPPKEPPKMEYEGGYVDIRRCGYAKPVGHLDVVSMYPHLMLNIKPYWDKYGIFSRVVRLMLEWRLKEKEKAKQGDKEAQKNQMAIKILINSFYGFLGATFRFSDPTSAQEITRRGRETVKKLCEKLGEYGFEVIEVDTDGVYFTAPDLTANDWRIEEIRLDFPMPLEYNFFDDGLFVKKKNYVLRKDGKTIIKGGLKTRRDNILYKELVDAVIAHLMDGQPRKMLFEKCKEFSKYRLDTYPKRWYDGIKEPEKVAENDEKQRVENMLKLFAVLRRFESVMRCDDLTRDMAKRLILEERQQVLFEGVELWH